MGGAPSDNDAQGEPRSSARVPKWFDFLFGGIGLVLIPWGWGVAARAHPGWSWGFLGTALGLLLAFFLLRGRRDPDKRERATLRLGLACAALGLFIGLAQLRDQGNGHHVSGSGEPDLSVPPSSAAPPSEPPSTAPPFQSPTPEGWGPLDPAHVVLTDDMSIDCGAFYDWNGPKEIVVDGIEMENGFDVGGSCSGGAEVRASFALEAGTAGFRVTAGILQVSGDPGPVPIRVLLNEDEDQEICEGNLSVGHPLQLAMDATGLSRVTLVIYLPERLADVAEVVGVGNAETSDGLPTGPLPSCGNSFEPE